MLFLCLLLSIFGIMGLGGASVRCMTYSWWETNMVISSKEPLANLGAEAVR